MQLYILSRTILHPTLEIGTPALVMTRLLLVASPSSAAYCSALLHRAHLSSSTPLAYQPYLSQSFHMLTEPGTNAVFIFVQ